MLRHVQICRYGGKFFCNRMKTLLCTVSAHIGREDILTSIGGSWEMWYNTIVHSVKIENFIQPLISWIPRFEIRQAWVHFIEMAIRSRKYRHPLKKCGERNLQILENTENCHQVEWFHEYENFYIFRGVEGPYVYANKSILKLCSYDLCLEYVKMCKSGHLLQKGCLYVF